MIILRIVDKTTGKFIRDDYEFDQETEIGLDVPPAMGVHIPVWSFIRKAWVEGNLNPETNIPLEQVPTLNEQIATLAELVYTIVGGS